MASHYENKDDEESTAMALRYLEKCLEVEQDSLQEYKMNRLQLKVVISKKKDSSATRLVWFTWTKMTTEKLLTTNSEISKLPRKWLLTYISRLSEWSYCFQDTKKDKKTLIEAYSAIAKSYINLGDIDQALEHLNQYYKIAKDAKKSNFQVYFLSMNKS